MSLPLSSIPYIVWAPALLVFARTAALFAASPLWGTTILPGGVRILLGLVLPFFTLSSGVRVQLPPQDLA